jgi:serine/threonine protein kinase/WD40 repeat protein
MNPVPSNSDPSMSPVARELFLQLLDLPRDQRREALATRGRGRGMDPAIVAQVARLLDADDIAQQANFMTSPTASMSKTGAVITEGPGSKVGSYKILQLIGEGGFGSVFLAEQHEPVRRRVALKIIKLGMDTRQVIARFEAERQALALMDHPHIARVLDGGATETGRPYFVMEYVIGDSITKFADAHALTVKERLDLFQQVCSAVQHAHTKGIIHRDLKPGNILVSMVDGKPFAKVIDFGIAKATAGVGGALTDKTLFTEHKQLIGTPEYMSPEQAEGSLDIDTRTDVYSLGVLLYELLTGTTPIDGKKLRSAALDEMRRMIRDDEPLAPSMKLSRSLDTLASTAAARKIEPGKLSGLVKGELDWIVLRSLEKERGRRYETASALAEGVRRHLAGEAVVAAPVSRTYRLSKFVRKNKGPVAAVSAVMLALVAGGSVAVWQWNRADRVASVLFEEQQDVRGSILGFIKATFDSKNYPQPRPGKGGFEVSQYDEGGWKLYRSADDRTLEIVALDAQGKEVPAKTRDVLQAAAYYNWRLLAALENTAESAKLQKDAAEWSAYTANLALAQTAMDGGNFPEARKRLADAPENKRGWEWALAKQLASLYDYAQDTTSYGSGFSTDGGLCYHFVVSHERDPVLQIVRVSDASTVREMVNPPAVPAHYVVRRKETPEGTVNAFEASYRRTQTGFLSPDGRYLVGLDGLGEFVALDTVEGRLLPPSGNPTYRNAAVTLNASGSAIALGLPSGDVDIWFLGDASPVARVAVGAATISALSLSRDARIVWTGDESGIVSRIDVDARRVTSHVRAHSRTINDLAVTSDEARVVSAAQDGVVRVWGAALDSNQINYRIRSREPRSVSVSADGQWMAVGTEFDLSVLGVSRAELRSRIPQYFGEGLNIAVSKFTSDGSRLAVANKWDAEGNFGSFALVSLEAEGGPDSNLDGWTFRTGSTQALAIAAILASSPNGPSGLTITTPDGTRRIAGGADKTVRFYETKDGKPTLPATAESPDGVYREVAVFRMDDAVTNLQMTGDGTRLIIHLADGSARVWDIRDPEERRKDLQAEWAERVPAGQYLNTLWASDTPEEKLRDAVIADQSLTPLRRLVAAEMLEERLEDDRIAAEQAYAAVIKDQTDKQAVLDAAAKLELPKRVKARVVAKVEAWKYELPQPSDAERLAEETKQRKLLETDRVAGLWGTTGEYGAPKLPSLQEFQAALAIREELLGHAHPRTLDILRMVALLESEHGYGGDRFAELVARAATASDRPTGHLISLYCEYASEAALSGDFERAEAALAFVREHVGSVADDEELSFGNSYFAEGRVSGKARDVRDNLLKFIEDEDGTELRRSAWFRIAGGPLARAISAIRRADQSFIEIASAGEEHQFNFSRRNPRNLIGIVLLRTRRGDLSGALGACKELCSLGDEDHLCFPTESIVRHALSGSEPATLAAAGEVDMKADPSLKAPLSAHEHRQRAREALAKARALMQPAADGTPSPWANDEDAKALIAEAAALIEK